MDCVCSSGSLWYNRSMFDEPGSNYQPAPPPRTVKESPIPEAVEANTTRTVLIPTARPLWLRVLGFYLGFQTVTRLFNLSGDNAAVILVQMATVGVMVVLTLGVLGMRRWGAWLFLMYAAWTIGSSLVVGTARMLVVDEVIENAATRQMVIASEFILISLTVLFNGAVALWVALNIKRFIPMTGPGRYGNAPFVVMVGILFLLTATQIQSARQDVAEQGDIVEDTTFSLPEFLR